MSGLISSQAVYSASIGADLNHLLTLCSQGDQESFLRAIEAVFSQSDFEAHIVQGQQELLQELEGEKNYIQESVYLSLRQLKQLGANQIVKSDFSDLTASLCFASLSSAAMFERTQEILDEVSAIQLELQRLLLIHKKLYFFSHKQKEGVVAAEVLEKLCETGEKLQDRHKACGEAAQHLYQYADIFLAYYNSGKNLEAKVKKLAEKFDNSQC